MQYAVRMKPKPALTCAFVNLKPGTGKTTCAMFTSSALHQLGRRVLTVDADPGMSALRWSDLASDIGEKLPWGMVGMPKASIHGDIVTVTQHGDWDTVVIDCPQMEDHERIVRGALEFADVWIMPLAPSPIELDRTVGVVDRMDQVDRNRDVPALRLALLNRTNRLARSAQGPDATCARILTERGFVVSPQQINHSDTRYRQSFGERPRAGKTPFEAFAVGLVNGFGDAS
jgi:chromosome partitioning protein